MRIAGLLNVEFRRQADRLLYPECIEDYRRLKLVGVLAGKYFDRGRIVRSMHYAGRRRTTPLEMPRLSDETDPRFIQYIISDKQTAD